MTTPLHGFAEGNRRSLVDRAAASGNGVDVLELVRREQRVSVNMRAQGVIEFLTLGRRWNVFEWAEAESQRIGRPTDQILRDKVKYHDRRLQFEHLAGGGCRFYYGALNVGGMGSPRYGRYCVVDRRLPAETGPDPVWVFEDSLRGCCFHSVPNDPTWDRLGDWVAPHDMAPELAAVKMATPSQAPMSLADRLCNDADYIEALSLGPLTRDAVQEIRSESDDEIQDRALAAALDAPTAAETLDLLRHEEVRSLADSHGIPWRVIR